MSSRAEKSIEKTEKMCYSKITLLTISLSSLFIISTSAYFTYYLSDVLLISV